MFNKERRQYILERLQRDGRIVAVELSAELGLSEDTIRRDLRRMVAEGLLQRVHGGALPRSPATANYASRQPQAPTAKRRIAQTAAGLVQDGQIIIKCNPEIQHGHVVDFGKNFYICFYCGWTGAYRHRNLCQAGDQHLDEKDGELDG